MLDSMNESKSLVIIAFYGILVSKPRRYASNVFIQDGTNIFYDKIKLFDYLLVLMGKVSYLLKTNGIHGDYYG